MTKNHSFSESGLPTTGCWWFLFLSLFFICSTAYSTTPVKESSEKAKPKTIKTNNLGKKASPLKPAYISMQMGNGKIHIDGTVSSQEERDVLVNAVVDRIGEGHVIDTLKISGKVAQADWVTKVRDLISTMVEGVTLSIKDGDIHLTGNIDGTKSRYQAVKQLADTSAKSGLKIDNKIEVGSVSSVLNISVGSKNIILKGEVPSQAHIDTLMDVSKKTFGSQPIVNRISTSDKVIEPKWFETIVQLIPELAGLDNGSLVVNDTSLTLSGLFQTEDARIQLQDKARKLINTDFIGKVTTKALKPASFNLRMGNGMIHIDGTVSSQEERDTLLKSATKRVGSENVINTLKVNEKTTPANWIDEIAALTESYIDGGWFSVKDNEVSLMGSVNSTQAQKKIINRFNLVLTGTNIKIIDNIKVNLSDSEVETIAEAVEPASEPKPKSEPFEPIQEEVTEVVKETTPPPVISENEKIKVVCQGMLDHVMKNNTIRFSTNSAIIRVKSYPLLDNLSSVLKECEVVIADKGVTIAGHTDSRGDASYNMSLSQYRADSVEKYLRKAGVHSTLITTRGYGEDQPVVSEDSAENKAEARAQNRRITIQIKRKKEG